MDYVEHEEDIELAPVAKLFPPQGQWTENDYFSLPETNRHVELSEGRLIVPPLPTTKHQRALLNFLCDCMPLWEGKIREPDIFFITKEHSDRIEEKFCGVPDLVMEVISPSARRVDQEEKFSEYARAGVQEYWLADPEGKNIEVYILQDNVYKLSGKYVPGERAYSKLLPGFEASVDEVFR